MMISPSPIVTPIGAKFASPRSLNVVTMLSIIIALSPRTRISSRETMFKVPPFEVIFLDIFFPEQHRQPRLHQLTTQVKGVADRFRAKVRRNLVEDPADVGLLDEKIAVEHVDGHSVGKDPEVVVRYHPLQIGRAHV